MKTATISDRWNAFRIKKRRHSRLYIKVVIESFIIIGTTSGVVVYLLKRAIFSLSRLPALQILVYAGPALGGLITEFIIYRIEPGARGEGMPS